MTYQFPWKRRIQEKNKTFNFQLQKSVVLVEEMVLSRVQAQIDVVIVEVMVGYGQTKVFLLFNKLVLNVLVVVKK